VGSLHVVVGLVFLVLGGFVLAAPERLGASGNPGRQGRQLSPRAWMGVGILFLVLGLVQISLGIAS
jgi:hypothetical protein